MDLMDHLVTLEGGVKGKTKNPRMRLLLVLVVMVLLEGTCSGGGLER